MSTQDASAFRDKVGRDGDRDILFNGPGDGSQHGHVVQAPDGHIRYARDVEQNVYVDERRGQVPPTPGNPNGYDQSRY